jgi:hypothetical protein
MLDVRPSESSSPLPSRQEVLPTTLQPAHPDQQLVLWRPPQEPIIGSRMRLVGFLCLALIFLGLTALVIKGVIGASTSATVNIAPQYSDVQVVTTVPAKTLSLSSSVTRQQTVAATGKGQQPARRAAGVLTFYNLANYPQTIPAFTLLSGADGVRVSTDTAATVQAGNPPVEASVDVPAHAEYSGAAGNISSQDIRAVPCCANIRLSGVVVSNQFAFAGGQDALTFAVVDQRDADAAAGSLEAPVQQAAQEGIQGQVPSNLQLYSAPQCTTHTHVNPPIGARATQVAVTVAETCQGQAYNQGIVLQAAVGEFMASVTRQPLAGYTLLSPRAQITGVAPGNRSGGTLSFVVLVQGRWLYQFNHSRLASLKQEIAGLPYAQALSTLQREVGVRQGTIHLSGGDTLPADLSQITVLIEPAI